MRAVALVLAALAAVVTTGCGSPAPTVTVQLETDAAVVAVAERLGITEIATLDRRLFHAVRPRHSGGFQLLL